MRYAIVSDVHGNAAALRTVLEMCGPLGIGQVVCLGDIVGYGSSPNECCEILQEQEIPSIVGNHDRAACGVFEPVYFPPTPRHRMIWTRSVLTAASKKYLLSLPETRVMDGAFVMAHGSLRYYSEYLLKEPAILHSFELLQQNYAGLRICFHGHTHKQVIHEMFDGRLISHAAEQMQLRPDAKYLINPGSIGYPRYQGIPLSFAVYDQESSIVRLIKLSKDEYPQLYVAQAPEIHWNAALLREYAVFTGRSGVNFLKNRLSSANANKPKDTG